MLWWYHDTFIVVFSKSKEWINVNWMGFWRLLCVCVCVCVWCWNVDLSTFTFIVSWNTFFFLGIYLTQNAFNKVWQGGSCFPWVTFLKGGFLGDSFCLPGLGRLAILQQIAGAPVPCEGGMRQHGDPPIGFHVVGLVCAWGNGCTRIVVNLPDGKG
jgi:hypothetical protein